MLQHILVTPKMFSRPLLILILFCTSTSGAKACDKHLAPPSQPPVYNHAGNSIRESNRIGLMRKSAAIHLNAISKRRRTAAASQADTAGSYCNALLKGNNTNISYLLQLEHRIKRNWFPPKPCSGIPGKVKVQFTILRDGSLENLLLVNSCALDSADQAALAAMINSAPFTPLPKDYLASNAIIEFTFDHNLFAGKSACRCIEPAPNVPNHSKSIFISGCSE